MSSAQLKSRLVVKHRELNDKEVAAQVKWLVRNKLVNNYLTLSLTKKKQKQKTKKKTVFCSLEI